MSFAGMMLTALIIEAAFGWPQAFFARIGHPVTWIGAVISRLETDLNRPDDPAAQRFWKGALAVLVVVGGCWAIGWSLMKALPDGHLGTLLGGLLAAPFLASRSLHDHVQAVAHPLSTGDTASARNAVARIVGRDPSALDPPGIARASIESLAENTSDGVIAPLFWGLLLGLPGLLAYKAINTLDSMIGYRNARHEQFGKFAARLDDAANIAPARLTGLGFALLGGRVGQSLGVMWRDANLHRSPNAGWPEAAMAAALNCRLSGPRTYEAGIEDHPWVNAGAPDPGSETIRAGLRLYRRLILATAALLLLIAAL